MNAVRFDAFVASMARSRSRREALMALVLALAPIGAITPAGEAHGAEVMASAWQGAGTKCKRKNACCSGQCRGRDGKKKRACSCTPVGGRCREPDDCCAAANTRTCVSGFCVELRT